MEMKVIGAYLASDAHALMRFEGPVHLSRLPIPEEHTTVRVAAHHVAAVWAEPDLACVPGVCVPLETFFRILSEALACAVHHNLIIEALTRDPRAAGVHRDAGH